MPKAASPSPTCPTPAIASWSKSPGLAAPARTVRAGGDAVDRRHPVAASRRSRKPSSSRRRRCRGRSRSRRPTTTVVTRDAIQARQLETVADALRTTPGFAVGRNGGRGALTSVFPRGGESDYTLVLVDGMRVNSFGGGFDFSLLPFGDVEQVEVVRGPQSAVFGADAIGGVVQLTTRRGGEPSIVGAGRRRRAVDAARAGRRARHGRSVVVRRRRRTQSERRLHRHGAGDRRDGVERRLGAVAGPRARRMDEERDHGGARGRALDRRRARQSRPVRQQPDWRVHGGRPRRRAARTRSASSA